MCTGNSFHSPRVRQQQILWKWKWMKWCEGQRFVPPPRPSPCRCCTRCSHRLGEHCSELTHPTALNPSSRQSTLPDTVVPTSSSCPSALSCPHILLQVLTVTLLCLRSIHLSSVSPVCLLTFSPLLCPPAAGRPLPRCTSKCCRQTTRVLRASPDNNTTWRSAKP